MSAATKHRSEGADLVLKRAVAYLRVSSDGQLGRHGEVDGYSLPAQEKACRAAAERHGAVLVKVYIDRGESAKTTKRPALREMWDEMGELDVDLLIVHKLDRLARNRFDDADMMRMLLAMGVSLVSATENIDDTNHGQMLQGILATVNQYINNNHATEVKKGLYEKHARGGTPFKPPIGYWWHHEISYGQDLRSVVVDPERAPLIQKAFDLYATGDWSLLDLTVRLESLGLTSRPTKKNVPKPLGVSAVEKILKNPYYSGVVVYSGNRVEGIHEPLVSKELFATVQQTLIRRRQAERASRHAHYLRGTVVCAHCGGRLLYTRNRAKSGTYYEYYSCVNRLARRRSDVGCISKHYPVAAVEHAVEQVWGTLRLTPAQAEAVRTDFLEWRGQQLSVAREMAGRHEKAVTELEDRQRKLLHLYYRGSLTDAVFQDEQAELAAQTAAARQVMEHARGSVADCEVETDSLLSFMLEPQELYRRARRNERRALNRAVWKHVRIDLDDGEADGDPMGFAAGLAPWSHRAVTTEPAEAVSVGAGFGPGPAASTIFIKVEPRSQFRRAGVLSFETSSPRPAHRTLSGARRQVACGVVVERDPDEATVECGWVLDQRPRKSARLVMERRVQVPGFGRLVLLRTRTAGRRYLLAPLCGVVRARQHELERHRVAQRSSLQDIMEFWRADRKSSCQTVVAAVRHVDCPDWATASHGTPLPVPWSGSTWRERVTARLYLEHKFSPLLLLALS